MTFWKDNRLDGEHVVTAEDAAAAFWADPDAGPMWLEHEGRFERHFTAWLSRTYGSWDPTKQAADFDVLLDTAWDARPR